jgi:DNA polymerase III subunit gamma/tau
VPQARRGPRGTGSKRNPRKPNASVSYKVLALKYRPTSFDEVVGQTTVTRTLQNALERGKIGHAFLLSGARGVGKTTTARILAKALNCAKGDAATANPCSTRDEDARAKACPSCREIADGRSLDVQEIDGASNTGVDSIRELREMTRFSPARDRYRIWIIDEVHQISGAAFNALLKTLEEPPPRVKFIFATTEYHKIPETILSRCQQFDFRMIPARELKQHLRHVADAEKIEVSDGALGLVARAAEGSVRDALSLFDQVLAFSGERVRDEDLAGLLGLVDRELLHRASRAIVEGDSLAMLELVESLADYGADYRNFLRELLLHLREVLLVKLAPADSPLVASILPEELEQLRPLAESLSQEDLLRGLDLLSEAETEFRNVTDPRVALDLVLLKLVQMRRLVPFVEVVARLERLAGAGPLPAAAQRALPEARPAPAARPTVSAPAPPSQPVPSARSAPPPRPAPAAPPPDDAPDDEPPEVATRPAAAAGSAQALLEAMLGQARPTLAPALRSAAVRFEGDTLVLEMPPDFAMLASAHADDYKALVHKAAGKNVPLRFASAAGAAAAAVAASPEVVRKQQLREEAEKEPAVQEALDLFDGRVVDVREAKPGREDA